MAAGSDDLVTPGGRCSRPPDNALRAGDSPSPVRSSAATSTPCGPTMTSANAPHTSVAVTSPLRATLDRAVTDGRVLLGSGAAIRRVIDEAERKPGSAPVAQDPTTWLAARGASSPPCSGTWSGPVGLCLHHGRAPTGTPARSRMTMSATGPVVVLIFANPAVRLRRGPPTGTPARSRRTSRASARASTSCSAPGVDEVYPGGEPQMIHPGRSPRSRGQDPARPLPRCVLTVVAKLFGLVRPRRGLPGRRTTSSWC